MRKTILALAAGAALFALTTEAGAQSLAEEVVRSFGSAARLTVTDCVTENGSHALNQPIVYGEIQSLHGNYRTENGFNFGEAEFDCQPGGEFIVLGGANPLTEPRRRRMSLPLSIDSDEMVDFSDLTSEWPQDEPRFVPLSDIVAWLSETEE